jgi:hypothetical protein
VIGQLVAEMDAALARAIQLRMRLGAFHSNRINVRADNQTGATGAGDARENASASPNIQHRRPRLLAAQQIHRSRA